MIVNKDAEREAFELLPDDERQCEHCKTTCFLSALTCGCVEEKLVCLRHSKLLCECPPEKHTLRYRYSMDELQALVKKLKVKVDTFNDWTSKLHDALSVGSDGEKIGTCASARRNSVADLSKNKLFSVELVALKKLMEEAESHRLPDMELVTTLRDAVEAAEKCATVAQQLISSKVRTRTRLQGEAKCRVTLEELQLFCQQLEQLPCTIPESSAIFGLDFFFSGLFF